MSAHTLERYIAQAPAFDWQHYNCVHFAGGWAAPAVLQQILGAVQMPVGSRAVASALRQLDASTLHAAVSARMQQEVSPCMARVGDLVLSGRTLGLCIGRCFVALGVTGPVALPMDRAVAAWRAQR